MNFTRLRCLLFPIMKQHLCNRRLQRLGMSIPRDLSLVGFADLDFAVTMTPPLTTMRQRPHEIGRLTAKLIVDRINGTIADENDQTTIKVPADLIVRSSTARPRVEK